MISLRQSYVIMVSAQFAAILLIAIPFARSEQPAAPNIDVATEVQRAIQQYPPGDYDHWYSSKSQSRTNENITQHLVGVTDEPSCGGTGLDVYLDGPDVHRFSYDIFTSRQRFHIDYFLEEDGNLVHATEYAFALIDEHAEPLREPRFESETVYDSKKSGEITTEKRRQFEDHALYLLQFFRKHRDQFKPAQK